MSGKIKNINTKGEVDVTIDEFDIRTAKITRSKKSDWDDFQLMCDSNKDEAEYALPSGTDPNKVEAALAQLAHKAIGAKILGAMEYIA